MATYQQGILVYGQGPKPQVGRNHKKNSKTLTPAQLAAQLAAQAAAALLLKYPPPKQIDVMSAKLDTVVTNYKKLVRQYNLHKYEMSSLMSGDVTLLVVLIERLIKSHHALFGRAFHQFL